MKTKRAAFRVRVLCAALALLLAALAALPALSALPAAALDYSFSAKYKSGKYYAALMSYALTGDQRYDVVSVALTQLGYHEGNSENDFDGLNTSGSRNFVEYNRIYGKVDNGEGNGISYGYAWCCAFVSWCMRQAGVPESKVTTEISCPRMITWLQQRSSYKTRASGYTPKPGDMIFFKSSTSSQTSSHIGLVLGVSNGYVYTVEGNSGGKVSRRSYTLSDTYIVGYGAPSYSVKPGTVYDFVAGGTTESPLGVWRVTADSLNVRRESNSSSLILGVVNAGLTVEVFEISGSWGRIFYNGDSGWISLNYAEQVSSLPLGTYSVTASTSLTVRSGPSADTAALGYLGNGDRVRVLEVSGHWGRLDYGGRDGWISLNYAALISAAAYYTVAFSANGGTGGMTPLEMERGKAQALPANAFSRTGYRFAGWSATASGTAAYTDGQSVTDLAPANGTVTLYAVWAVNHSSIVYEANGGRGYVARSLLTYGIPSTLRPNAYTRSGYAFDGWTCTRASDGKCLVTNGTATAWMTAAELAADPAFAPAVLADGAAVPEISTVNGEVWTLSARWRITALRGDCDGDSSRNGFDLLLLRRYLADAPSETGIGDSYPGMDANGDGKITALDLALMRRYLAGMNYATGQSDVVLE